jgi:hypothetical protein
MRPWQTLEVARRRQAVLELGWATVYMPCSPLTEPCPVVQIMVATDVAARGLHIRGLPFVCNYDVPSNLDQYIHRCAFDCMMNTPA